MLKENESVGRAVILLLFLCLRLVLFLLMFCVFALACLAFIRPQINEPFPKRSSVGAVSNQAHVLVGLANLYVGSNKAKLALNGFPC